jgi:biofilm PGA synthesis protein PgaD
MTGTQKQLHIDAPELLTGRQRTRDMIFTAIMWGVYLYLWAPLVTLFAWLLGFEFAYDVMVRAGGARDLERVLVFYGVVVAVIFVVVAFWSLGNRLRYGRLQRRQAGQDLSITAMAESFGVDVATIERLRSISSVSIDFDAEGHPVVEAYERVPNPDPEAAKAATRASVSHA